MNDIKLYNDDCFNIFPKIEDDSVDCVIVDLPYGQTNCDWDTIIDLDKMWTHLKRIGTDTTAYVFFCTTKFGYKLIQSNEKSFRYDIVWEKPNAVGFLSANKMPLRAHEMIYVFYKKLPTYNPQKTIGHPFYKRANRKANQATLYGANRTDLTVNKTGDRFPRSVQNFTNPHKKSGHPTQKPIELCEWLVKSYSNEGQTVLDFTMGSGSTGVACINTKRKFIGIEMNAEYYQVAKDRLNA